MEWETLTPQKTERRGSPRSQMADPEDANLLSLLFPPKRREKEDVKEKKHWSGRKRRRRRRRRGKKRLEGG